MGYGLLHPGLFVRWGVRSTRNHLISIKFTCSAVQISVWTERKCWKISCQQSVWSNFSAMQSKIRPVLSRDLTLFKTKFADFPTLFKTEFRFLIPCLRHLTRNHTLCKTIINIETLSYLIHWQSQNYLQLDHRVTQAVYRPRKYTLFKTNIDKIDTLIKTKKMIKSIPCLRQKSRKTYPGWPHVPIKPL